MLIDDAPARSQRATDTLMHREAGESGTAVRRFLDENRATLQALGARLRELGPMRVTTCARGSSDHAATYAKYLIETMVGVPVSSAALSVSSIYDAPVHVAGRSLCLAISQSGRSPDLLEAVRANARSGALTVAIVNDGASPLADMADVVLPLSAGPELSVAATKSFVTSLAAIAALVGAWRADAAFADAIAALPDDLDRAFGLDWSAAQRIGSSGRSLFVIGRGYSLAVAAEAALKLKETCGLHAEAFSSAEVRHGPMAIVNEGFPILAFATSDAAGDDVRALAGEFRVRGADVVLADSQGDGDLPAIACLPALEPILTIESFYRFANMLSLSRGLDPDVPPHLRKVTSTR